MIVVINLAMKKGHAYRVGPHLSGMVAKQHALMAKKSILNQENTIFRLMFRKIGNKIVDSALQPIEMI